MCIFLDEWLPLRGCELSHVRDVVRPVGNCDIGKAGTIPFLIRGFLVNSYSKHVAIHRAYPSFSLNKFQEWDLKAWAACAITQLALRKT